VLSEVLVSLLVLHLLLSVLVLVVFFFFVVVGLVKDDPAEEQVGEQVGAALLVGTRILRAQASGCGGEQCVDGGGVDGGDLAREVSSCLCKRFVGSEAQDGQRGEDGWS
jgi:hypothetical protein